MTIEEKFSAAENPPMPPQTPDSARLERIEGLAQETARIVAVLVARIEQMSEQLDGIAQTLYVGNGESLLTRTSLLENQVKALRGGEEKKEEAQNLVTIERWKLLAAIVVAAISSISGLAITVLTLLSRK